MVVSDWSTRSKRRFTFALKSFIVVSMLPSCFVVASSADLTPRRVKQLPRPAVTSLLPADEPAIHRPAPREISVAAHTTCFNWLDVRVAFVKGPSVGVNWEQTRAAALAEASLAGWTCRTAAWSCTLASMAAWLVRLAKRSG